MGQTCDLCDSNALILIFCFVTGPKGPYDSQIAVVLTELGEYDSIVGGNGVYGTLQQDWSGTASTQ